MNRKGSQRTAIKYARELRQEVINNLQRGRLHGVGVVLENNQWILIAYCTPGVRWFDIPTVWKGYAIKRVSINHLFPTSKDRKADVSID